MDDPNRQPGSFDATIPESTAAPRSRREYTSGETIDRKYQLLRRLEQGGMGEVWVAHNLALDVHVALKLILPEQGSELADERLLREARAAARLNHPAVVRIFDVGRAAGGESYLVMELLNGEPFAELLAREGRLAPAAAVRALLPIAGALASMHAKGMIHRDVKPENIFLSRDDAGRTQPKLIDFGIAKLDERAGLRKLTRRGALIGTPNYMAPEQVQGSADARTDVWALCVVLYEALAGDLPFVGDTYPLVLTAVLAASPPPLSTHGLRDEALCEIVERGLRPLDERWQSMRELGKALAGWLWAQGETDDVTGVSLRSSWIGDVDVRRLSAPPSARHVATQRMPAPVLDRPRPPETPRAAPSAAPAPSIPPIRPPISTSASAIPVSMSPTGTALRRPNRIPAVIIGAGVLGALAILGFAALRRPAELPGPAALPAPSATAPTTASADATPSPPELPSAASSAPGPAPSIPRRPSNGQRDAGPARGAELKNPFH